MGIGGGLAGMKPKVASKPKLRFVEKDVSEGGLGEKQWKMTISERMRYLDDVRKHSLLSDEAAFLNVPDGRLDLHMLKSILHVCGGCSGARFSTENFLMVKELIADMEPAWAGMEASFKKLGVPQRKIILENTYIVEPPAAAETTEEAEDNDDPDEEEEGGVTLPPLPEGVDADVVAFHRLADSWCRLADRMMVVVKEKQSSLPSTEERKALISQFANADPDGLDQAKSMPDWLETVLAKYKAEGAPLVRAAVENRTINKDGKDATPLQANPDTIGKLSCFLSFMVCGAIPITDDDDDDVAAGNGGGGDKDSCSSSGAGSKQRSALREVLQASNDSQRVLTNGEQLDSIMALEREGGGEGQGYWAQRLYNFVSKVRELKGMVKEEKALNYPHIWTVAADNANSNNNA
jgi:hypothetical protein